MELEVLVSTMNQDKDDYSLLEEMKIESNATIINQCGQNHSKIINYRDKRIKWINSNKKGLSISRNMAIQEATDSICILADDDLEYIDNYQKIILKQFSLYPEADIITFQVEGIEKRFKEYYSKPRRINYITSMKVSSVEVAFRLSSIKNKNIEFNELFGSGAKYLSGEENIFLYDCLKNGLKLQYVPIKIANLHIGDSSWFKGYNKEYFVGKGAMFTSISRLFSSMLILQFGLRKYKLYKNEISISKAIRYMLAGRKEYINLKHNCY